MITVFDYYEADAAKCSRSINRIIQKKSELELENVQQMAVNTKLVINY